MVHQKVVKSLELYYKNFQVNVTTKYDVLSEHCQPTLTFGNSCYDLESPFINHCNYDGGLLDLLSSASEE